MLYCCSSFICKIPVHKLCINTYSKTHSKKLKFKIIITVSKHGVIRTANLLVTKFRSWIFLLYFVWGCVSLIVVGIIDVHIFSLRSVFWPCGECRLNCSANAVQCKCCNSWYHYQCQNLTLMDIEHIVRPDSGFTCLDCFRQEISPYTYEGAILRLGLVRYR